MIYIMTGSIAINAMMMEPLKKEMYNLTNVYHVMNILALSVPWGAVILSVPNNNAWGVTLSVEHPQQITLTPVSAVML